MDVSEAFVYGSIAINSKKGSHVYNQWRTDQYDLLYEIIYGEKRKNVIEVYKEKEEDRKSKLKEWANKLRDKIMKGG